MKIKIICFTFCILSFCVQANAQEKTKLNQITENTLKDDIEKVDCDEDDKRLEAVKNLFIEKGVNEERIEIKDFENVKNLVVSHTGKTGEIIVVGAHYDKTANGCGAIDNWTGIVILANLYKRISEFDTNKTFKFVAFGKEEVGLVGARAMVKAIPKEEKNNYCAMVNFDSFGFAYPQALKNVSSGSLISMTEEIAQILEIPFAKASISFASSDSQAFKEKGIPAITLHGLNNNWDKYLHTVKDKPNNINYSSVWVGYNVGLRLLAKTDTYPCQKFKEKYEFKKEKK